MTSPPSPDPYRGIEPAEVERVLAGVARRVAGRPSPELLDDLVQVGRLAVWQAAASWWPEGGVALRPWCYTAARHRMIDHLRAELRIVPLELDEDLDAGDAGRQVDQAEARLDLERRLDQLRPRQRRLAELLLEGASVEEAAAALRQSVRTTWRDRARLRVG